MMKKRNTGQLLKVHEPSPMSRLSVWLMTGVVALIGPTLAQGQSFVTVNVPFDPGLAILQDAGQLNVSWRGEGVLESAPSPLGPWTSTGVTNGSSVLSSPEDAQTFFRIENPHPRSVELYVPSAAGQGSPIPLVILLHAATTSGSWQEDYMRFQPLAEARGFFYCYPDAVLYPNGNRAWNLEQDDCLRPGVMVDDVAFLRSLINEIVRTQDGDPRRIYLIGHSNGGAMAYQMAHDESTLITGIAILAGRDRAIDIPPSQPVNILHIHGTADTNTLYGGGSTIRDCPRPYLGAMAIIEGWATYNGATDLETEMQPSMDLIEDVAGLETIVSRYTNAPAGGAVELWSIQNGPHVPSSFSPGFAPAVVDWLLSHPRPVQ